MTHQNGNQTQSAKHLFLQTCRYHCPYLACNCPKPLSEPFRPSNTPDLAYFEERTRAEGRSMRGARGKPCAGPQRCRRVFLLAHHRGMKGKPRVRAPSFPHCAARQFPVNAAQGSGRQGLHPKRRTAAVRVPALTSSPRSAREGHRRAAPPGKEGNPKPAFRLAQAKPDR